MPETVFTRDMTNTNPITTHLVTELDRLVRENGTDDPTCPVCKGLVEITPSNGITCTERGSEHYRWDLPSDGGS